MNKLDYKVLYDHYEIEIYSRRDVVLVEGSGATVTDCDGNTYIDCVAGHGVASIGHCNEDVVEAISRQARRLITCGGTFYNDTRGYLLEKLINIAPPGLKKAFLCNSGTEAIEAALKFARFSTRRTDFICAMKGFHGRSMGALSATFKPRYKKDFLPLVPGFHFVPYNNFEKLEITVKEQRDKIAGILLEPVQGEGGVHVGNADYFRNVRQLCRENDILLIVDEVQTGFCRTGRMFGIDHFGIEPDILCLAKAMAGGLPIGAVLCSDKILPPKGNHGTTFGGNPLTCAAALAAIRFMEKNRLAREADEKGQYLLERLNRIDSPKIRDIRGLGLITGIELKEKVTPYLQTLMQNGVLALHAGSTVLRLLPPLTISYRQLDTVITAIERCLQG